MALPKFYTQVLHLMNKMNLPPPFEENAIPGVFSRDRETKQQQYQARQLSLKRKFPGAQRSSFIVEEDEDEDNDEAKQADQSSDAPNDSNGTAKKQRVQIEVSVKADDAAKTAPEAVQEPVQRHVSVVAALHPSKPKALSTRIARAFESSGLGTDRRRAARPGVISEQELERQRLPATGKHLDDSCHLKCVAQLS